MHRSTDDSLDTYKTNMVGSRKQEGFNELPVEAATRKSINANCGDASLEKESSPEPGWQPSPQFAETSKQLFRVKNVQLPLTWSVLELMAALHPSHFKHLQVP